MNAPDPRIEAYAAMSVEQLVAIVQAEVARGPAGPLTHTFLPADTVRMTVLAIVGASKRPLADVEFVGRIAMSVGRATHSLALWTIGEKLLASVRHDLRQN